MKWLRFIYHQFQYSSAHGVKHISLGLTILALLALVGCSESPNSEMEAANAAVENARLAEAAVYTPEAWQMIQDSLNAAVISKQEQDEKFALFRSYTDVKGMFTRVETQAKTVVTEALTQKELVKNEVTSMLATAQQAVTTTSEALKKASRAQSELEGVSAILNDATNDFNVGNYLSAKTKSQQVIDRSNAMTQEMATTAVSKKPVLVQKPAQTSSPVPTTTTTDASKIEWVSYDVGVQRAKKENKHVVVDFTTSWCGWCKKMEAETFSDPAVIKLMNDNFVSVKVIGDSEKKLDIDGYKISESDLTTKTFGVRGFPAFAFLTAEGQSLGTLPGYRPKESFVELLNFVKDKKYLEEMKKQEEQKQKDAAEKTTTGNN